MKIQESIIQEANKVYKYGISYKHYSSFSYFNLCSSHSQDQEYFINRDGLTFQDYVGCKYLTGNELLYYPRLAQKMRNVKEYPTLTRRFDIDKNIQGLAFIKYFYEHVMKCYQAFEKDLLQASQVVNQLIHNYGTKRHLPIVDRIAVEEVNSYYKKKKLVINGVTWELDDGLSENHRIIDYINLHKLLNISFSNFKCIKLEDALVGTPFIALRIAKSYSRHKGHVYWYNLDTLKRVKKADIAKWKKS